MKQMTQLELYSILDKLIATNNKDTFMTILQLLEEARTEKGYQWNDRKKSLPSARKMKKNLFKRVKLLTNGKKCDII